MATEKTVVALALEYVKTIGIANNAVSGRGFANPCDLAISEDGRIFVINRCDTVRRQGVRVGVCTLGEEYLTEFGNGYGDAPGQFVWPVAMAFDSRDRLHITDEHNGRVTVFSSSGEFISVWGDSGEVSDQLNRPSGIGFDSSDTAYVADQSSNSIKKFNRDGDFLGAFGESGSGLGQLDTPWGVTVDALGCVYVADWRNDRVQKFDSGGEPIAIFGNSGDGNGEFHRPSDVTVDEEGFIYVADWGNERVQVLEPGGKFQVKLRGQATVSQWADEFLAANPDEAVERSKSNLIPDLPLHLSSPYDVSSQTEPYFWGPVSVELDREGRLYVLETNRHRFQVYQRV